MRKEWNIETVNITPVTPKIREEEAPATKRGRLIRFIKKNWLKSWLIVLCAYAVFFMFGMLISDYYVDENGIRQPIVLSFDYLNDREDYKQLRRHYDAISDLVVDITIIDIHLANDEITAMEAATQYASVLNEKVDIMIPKINAMELGEEQIVIQESMETLLSNDIAVYLQKMIDGLKTGNTASINTAMVWRDKFLSAFNVIRGDMTLLCEKVKVDATSIKEWNLSDEALKKDSSAYLKNQE